MYFDELNKKLNVLAKAGMKDAFYAGHEVINRSVKNKTLFKGNNQNFNRIGANGSQLSLFN